MDSKFHHVAYAANEVLLIVENLAVSFLRDIHDW